MCKLADLGGAQLGLVPSLWLGPVSSLSSGLHREYCTGDDGRREGGGNTCKHHVWAQTEPMAASAHTGRPTTQDGNVLSASHWRGIVTVEGRESNVFMAAGFLEEVALGLTQGQFPGSGKAGRITRGMWKQNGACGKAQKKKQSPARCSCAACQRSSPTPHFS